MKNFDTKNLQKIIVATIIAVATFFYILTGDENVSFWENNSKNADVDQNHHVTRVIDGDTFVIETGEYVRMIGIDTPERGQLYYNEAKEYLEGLIDSREVRLEKDRSEVDRYNRLLRHVYVGDQWINKEMIEDGYARFVTFPPDVAHVEEFRTAEQKAREKSRGIWNFDQNN